MRDSGQGGRAFYSVISTFLLSVVRPLFEAQSHFEVQDLFEAQAELTGVGSIVRIFNDGLVGSHT